MDRTGDTEPHTYMIGSLHGGWMWYHVHICKIEEKG